MQGHLDSPFRPGVDLDNAGNDLAEGFFLVPWVLKGDLDHFAKGWMLRHYAANEFCEFCPAHSDTGDYGMC